MKVLDIEQANGHFYIDIQAGHFIFSTNKLDQNEIEFALKKQGKKFPFIIFVGSQILPEIESYNTIHVFPLKKKSLEIEYRLKDENKIYRVIITTNIHIEYYPIYIGYVTSIKEEIPSLQKDFKKKIDLVVFEKQLNRLDVLKLKINFPKAKLVMAGEYIPIHDEGNWDNYRITNIVSKLGNEILSKNLVYSARYYLRNLDLKKMYELPFTFKPKKEELEIVIAFLELMIRNENQKEDLRKVNMDLRYLKFYYQFIYDLIDKNFSKLEEILSKKITELLSEIYPHDSKKLKNLLEKLLEFVRFYKKEFLQKKVLKKTEEIQYWEIETLLELQLNKI